jgi:hypothetical protein
MLFIKMWRFLWHFIIIMYKSLVFIIVLYWSRSTWRKRVSPSAPSCRPATIMETTKVRKTMIVVVAPSGASSVGASPLFIWVTLCHEYMIYIDYYMAFFISYPLSARGHDISSTTDRLKGWCMNEGWYRVCYEKWHVMICLSYISTEEITDLYQNV